MLDGWLGFIHQLSYKFRYKNQAVGEDCPYSLVEESQLLKKLGIEGLIVFFGQALFLFRGPGIQLAAIIQQFIITLLNELLW